MHNWERICVSLHRSPALLSPCRCQTDTQQSVNVRAVSHKWIINDDTLKSHFPCHKTVCLSTNMQNGERAVKREGLHVEGKQKCSLAPSIIMFSLNPCLYLFFDKEIFVCAAFGACYKWSHAAFLLATCPSSLFCFSLCSLLVLLCLDDKLTLFMTITEMERHHELLRCDICQEMMVSEFD